MMDFFNEGDGGIRPRSKSKPGLDALPRATCVVSFMSDGSCPLYYGKLSGQCTEHTSSRLHGDQPSVGRSFPMGNVGIRSLIVASLQ